MGITVDGELQHTGWVKKMLEILQEDVEIYSVKQKVTGSTSRQTSTFPEVFIFPFSLNKGSHHQHLL
jgi:hypothetical protein